MYILPWAIYILKHNTDEKDTLMKSKINIWIIIEIMYYFNWIICIGLFMALSYLFRLKTISKDLDELKQDENVYNDKNTYDILGILKYECYIMSFSLNRIITNI